MISVEFMDEAICGFTKLTQQEKNDIFFPIEETQWDADVADALFCGHCPVNKECLDYAVRMKSSGIWAGTTTEQRKRLRKLVKDARTV